MQPQEGRVQRTGISRSQLLALSKPASQGLGCHHLPSQGLSPSLQRSPGWGHQGRFGNGSKGSVAALACPKAVLSLRGQTPSGTGTSRGGTNLQVRQSETCLDAELKTRVKVEGQNGAECGKSDNVSTHLISKQGVVDERKKGEIRSWLDIIVLHRIS